MSKTLDLYWSEPGELEHSWLSRIAVIGLYLSAISSCEDEHELAIFKWPKFSNGSMLFGFQFKHYLENLKLSTFIAAIDELLPRKPVAKFR